MSTCIVSYSCNGERCEIICKPETVSLYREGRLSLKETVITDSIFRDAKKGDLSSRDQLAHIFCTGTDGVTDEETTTPTTTPTTTEMLDTILKQGTYSLTTNEMRALKDQAFRAVVGYVKRTYTDAKGQEYTPSQIEAALHQCKLNVDIKKDAAHNFLVVKKKLENIILLKPKPGDIPYHVHVTWSQHDKVFGRIKKYLVAESKDEDGYNMELMVPSGEFKTISALF